MGATMMMTTTATTPSRARTTTTRARQPGASRRCAARSSDASSDAVDATDADDDDAGRRAGTAFTRRRLALGVGALATTTMETRRARDAVAVAAETVPKAPALRQTTVRPSRVIKGNWQLSGGHAGDRATDRTRGDDAVADFATFVDAGVTTFDTGPEACGYGPSETVIGEYLRTAHGRAHANEIEIFTKLCCVGREQSNMTMEWVEANVERPRRRLGVEKISMVQMYWNDYGRRGYVDAALYLTDLKHQGKIGAVSLTNFDTKRMKEMVDAGAEISTNQIQFSLLDRRPEKVMTTYCRETGIGLLPYGVVAGGLLSDKYLNVRPEKVVTNTYSLQKYASVIGQVGGYEWYQKLLRTLRAVGDKHGGASVSNVASKWVLDSPVVPAIIVGARNANHVADHVALFDFELDASDRAAIAAVLAEGRQSTEDAYTWERGGAW